MRKILISLTFISQFISATNYYVSPNGNDNNDGLTVSTSFLTIERSTYAVAPGDTVFIRNGIYSKTAPESVVAYMSISGTANNPITFRNYPNENPIIQMNATNWVAISISGNDYIVIDGLTIIGNADNITLAYAQSQQLNTSNPATSSNGIAITSEYNNETNRPHHNIIKNCKVSKCGGGGIYTYNADYTTIENNIVSSCGWYSPYGNSGISMYQNWNSDSNNTVFKNFITGNTCYRNENFIPFFVAGTITDGNGIIIDDSRNTQNNSTLGIYLGKTYVANNLVFDNGARGIHCYESDNVLIINNTCYQNCKSPATREGELTAFDASNISFVNNIVSPNTGIPPIAKDNNTTSNITAFNNLFTSNASLSNPSGTNTITGFAEFVLPSTNAAIADFHLTQDSFAINTGLITNAPIKDKDGIVRLTNNLVDIGCYEYVSALKINSFDSNSISIYPNPTKDYFSVRLPVNLESRNIKIEILDLLGRKIKTLFIDDESNKINTSDLTNGTYIIRIISEETTISRKLIVE